MTPKTPVTPSLSRTAAYKYLLDFGKFQGRTLREVPGWYIGWLTNKAVTGGDLPDELLEALRVINNTEKDKRNEDERGKESLSAKMG